MKNEKILVIYNPSAGLSSKKSIIHNLIKLLKRNFCEAFAIASTSPGHGAEIVSKSLSDYDIIAVFGGDGTINSIAAEMTGRQQILGIIPGGSGNGLARNLGIPLSWKTAVNTLIFGTDIYIDAGKINGHFFLNMAGIGLDGFISKKFNLESKSRGIVPYMYYALKGYIKASPFNVSINNGESLIQNVMIVAFANFRQYGAKLIIAPQASPCDQKLDLCILHQFPPLKIPYHIRKFYSGNIHHSPYYSNKKIEVIELESLSGKIPFHFDGEYGGADFSRYKVEILSAKIKIRIPAKKKK